MRRYRVSNEHRLGLDANLPPHSTSANGTKRTRSLGTCVRIRPPSYAGGRIESKHLALILVLCGLVIGHQTYKAKATKQKLTGEALVNFVKQCETDAYMDCVQQAEDRKLVGTASDSFMDSCVAKALGAGPRWCVPHYCQDKSECTGGDGCGVCWAGLCGK
jgi:hypothetical protein